MIQYSCETCGKAFMRVPSDPGRYCSVSCHAAARRAPLKLCEFCGVNRVKPRNSKRFCSVACYLKKQTALRTHNCLQCGSAYTRARPGKGFCSISCSRLSATKVPVATAGKAPSRPVVQVGVKPHIAILTELYPTFTPVSDIITRMNAASGKTYSRSAVGKIASAMKLKRPIGFAAFNANRQWAVSPRRVTPSVLPTADAGPRPITIHYLRELHQYAGELRMVHDIYVNRDLEPAELTLAISRAYQRVEPGHPGFRLKQQSNRETRPELMVGRG